MHDVRTETIEMPALGRPFNLGMLYDCRADTLVPGVTLWDHEELAEDMTETHQPNSEFEIVASESISDKSSSMGVEASLKASFFCGLVKVDGSAKYLHDTQTSKRQARVTLQYKTTTKFKKLTMNHLGKGNIKHPYIFDQGLATHVVTAILYGAQAFFVFDREVSDTENQQDIQGNLQVMIKKIPSISIEGEGTLKMEDKDKEKVNRFSCRFHGDFNLSQSPVTFEDAVKVYKDLPTLLGPDGENAVPVKVWLLPLTSLDSAAAKLVRQISVRSVFEVEKTLEFFGDLEMRCQDLLKSLTSQQLPQIALKMKSFVEFCSEFKQELQGVLARKLPSIRGGGEDEAELTEILKKRAVSPFSNECLDQWLSCKGKEANLIKTFTNIMSTDVSSQTELDEKLSSTKNAICLVFTALEREEPYLAALDQYLKGAQSDKPSPRAKDIEKEQWYCSKEVREAVRQKAKLFGDFAEANKENDNLKFFAACFKDENNKGSTIYLYEDGFEDSDDFEPPSKPGKLNVGEVTHNSVSLRFRAPTYGTAAVTGYRLEFCETGGEWKLQTEAEDGTVTVTGLSPDTEYTFRVRAVTDVGLGPATEVRATKTSPEPEGPRRLAEELRKTCEHIETKGSLEILKIPLEKDALNIPGCERFIFGKESVKKNCTIMVMGATGAGKSTLINGMINYILGVQWTDPYRFKLIVEEELKSQAHSQTSEVTVYKMNHDDGFNVDFSLTIIDIPRFGDTRGIKRDREITEQIRNLFSNNFGVDDIHAVCFVAQSALARLSATQRYVFDSVLSIFGKDVAENIRVLVTFADGQTPPVLEAIKEAGVPCPKTEDGQPAHYKFNNSALFAENKTSAKSFDEMFWDMGKANMRSFFDALGTIDPKSLTLTKEVLQERKRLEESIDIILRKVKEGLAKMDEIKQTEELLKNHQAEIKRNKDFKVTVKVMKPFQEDISGSGKLSTNCQVCHYTCHYPCDMGNDAGKKQCSAMDQDGNCTQCPKKCAWSKHFNQRYRFEYREVSEVKTIEEFMKKYVKGTAAKRSEEKLVSALKQQYHNIMKYVQDLAQKANGLINKLQSIGLNPNSHSAPDYIDQMIESEQNQRKPGWEERVQSLKEVKEQAQTLEELDGKEEFSLLKN